VKTYRINEMFYSLQGEGARAGSANVFIRFAGCDLACAFCDTEFEAYKELSAHEVVAQAARLMATNSKHPLSVILSGGEPSLQYDEELAAGFRAMRAFVAIETNGGTKLKVPVDWVSCSPKVAEHVVAANFPEGVDELRYVRHPGQAIPRPLAKADHYFLSPEHRGDRLSRESLEWCIELVKQNPEWKLSVQQHKQWRVR
jgi:7-carboxy-7-deazaguanine synthase